MFRPSRRDAATVLLFAFLTGCGVSEPAAPISPAPTASIALGADSLTVSAGDTIRIPVTVTRNSSFTGEVRLSASGLPAGLTVIDQTIPEGATSGTLQVISELTSISRRVNLTVTGTGTGVTIADRPLAVLIYGRLGSASIALSAASATVTAGDTAAVVVTLTRGAPFAGDVIIDVYDAPSGVSAARQTIAAGATTATVLIATTTSAASGRAALRLQAAPADLSLSIEIQPFALTITRPINQIGSDITSSEANFGKSLALSADGSRMVVAANSATNGGTTRVYERTGSTWTQLGADINAEAASDLAGNGVAMNAAGTRIAIGAPYNAGSGAYSGHVRVYDLVGSTWTQVGADIDGQLANAGLGFSVALSGNGTRLIAGAPGVGRPGSVSVFDLVAGTWTQVGATLNGGMNYGKAVEISADGSTIAVSTPSDFGSDPGSARVYRLSGNVWAPLGSVLTGVQAAENFGASLALSATGSRLVVGAPNNTEAAPVGSNHRYGAVRVFDLVGGSWTQVGSTLYGRAGGTDNNEFFGQTVGITDDGTRWAAAAAYSSSARTYTLQGGAWVQTWADIRNNNSGFLSEGLALSADGSTVALGFYQGTPKRVSVFSIAP